jgi:hypothetical protein
MTTVGYGTFVPRTEEGHVFTIAFAAVGIPVVRAPPSQRLRARSGADTCERASPWTELPRACLCGRSLCILTPLSVEPCEQRLSVPTGDAI